MALGGTQPLPCFTAPRGRGHARSSPGDAIVSIPTNPDDTYRVAADECTYVVVMTPGQSNRSPEPTLTAAIAALGNRF
jgi:hypothetical protein